MCGRYTFISPAPAVEKRFDATFTQPMPPNYNAAPSQQLPIITNAEPGRIQLVRWGLLPGWVRDVKTAPKPINARAETLTEKPSFRQLLQRRRCLVLADSFYEWQQTAGPKGPKTPHRILLRNEQPFAFAGLWDEWADRETGEVLPTFTIITTEPNELMVQLHNRMPVLLPDRAAELAWLDDGVSVAAHQALLRPYAAALMQEYAVSTQVNSPAHNDPTVLAPAA
ncbi:Putative SOS response-associated peptidase YedK [Hymenobacter daecheongensis DSM 21074]|uniref:Abasic site processing protein n=1 Tax=Hymenobacter daecheongensis DSM 21074 TaxID=1121955 RepID=A0A1M6ISK4_9BACT|nr:SOS response-associated peptidase [Hymenobacter daecheongensis]SHJ37450.1 Putative SOS response-associated peptidase YedK [Hymenobacter daecheongensis DSM 21074]